MSVRTVEYSLFVVVGIFFAAFFSPPSWADVTIKTPSGHVIERIKQADAAEVLAAQARGVAMIEYFKALQAPTVSSTCVPQMSQLPDGTPVITSVCTHSYSDPNRLKVDASILKGPTNGWDVAQTFVAGVTGVAKSAIGAAPYAALAYGINQTRKAGTGGKQTTIEGSYNDRSGNSDSYNTRGDTDNRHRYGETGASVGSGQVGDAHTADPTVIPATPPVIVDPVVVTRADFGESPGPTP